jgi:D-beta-D-heptose 7-phosphate kinase/D-beta-D-heptose 1-phosphate adenosyltransferase
MQPSLRERMLRIAADAMTATSVTVLSDRGHGTLDAVSIEQLLAGARQVGRRVIADIENTAGSVARYRGCDVMIRITTDGDPPAAAESLRLAAEAGTVLLVRPEGGLAIADRDGARMVATGTWLGNAGNYERIVAALAASLAVGRSAQTACLTAWSIIRPATPS